MVTIDDVWKHISNKIANKVNDPFAELFAMVIPVDTEGNFCKEINSDCEEYEGDSYTLLRKLSKTTELLPSGTFAYACPAKIRQVDLAGRNADEIDAEELEELRASTTPTQVLMINLVHAVEAKDDGHPGDMVIESGVYYIDENRFEALPTLVNGSDDQGQDSKGPLTIALGALALAWALSNDRLGDVGRMLKESLDLAKKSLEQAEAAFNNLPKP
jgi:hypothetical protein